MREGCVVSLGDGRFQAAREMQSPLASFLPFEESERAEPVEGALRWRETVLVR